MVGALYIKTHYTLLSSMIKIPDLIIKAKEYGYQSIAITDTNMYGVMEFYKTCKKQEIKPIVGLELDFNGFKIVLYAKNYLGYQNLIKLTTIKSYEKITLENLITYSNNLILVLPYESRKLEKDLNKIYEHVFIGYKNICEKEDINNDNSVYFNETLYLEKTDSEYLKYLEAIKNGIVDEEFDKRNNYLKSIDEIDDLKNNKKIVELCNLKLEKNHNLLPKFNCPNNLDSHTHLKQICIKGLKKIFGDKVYQIYLKRLKYELDIINKMGFSDYFLIVEDYVRFAKEKNILVGAGRGSAPGSLVAYVLNITDIDPIKNQLLFERFLNPERITMPDIDIDFEYTKRHLVIDYCMKKYGIKKVAGIITFGTLASKQIIRDICRVVGIKSELTDKLSKLIDSKLSLKDNLKSEKLRLFLTHNKNLNKIYNISSKLEGLKRHTSIHAAGIVMSNDNLDNYIPLDKSNDNHYLTGYSMEYLEDLGLLKMDFLGLKNLTILANTIEDVATTLNKEINLNDIPLDDSKTINLFNKGNTIGIFQFESEGMINFLKKYQANNFNDIVTAVALFRPGPMDNIDLYIKRKQLLEKTTYYHQDLEPILKSTHGIIIYQEQIILIASLLAGYTLGEADVLRRAMTKKNKSILIKEEIKFINGSIKNGYDKEVAKKIYDLILKFASYGFNKSHSVAYSKIAFQMAYFKAHFPAYFIKNLLNASIGSSINTKEYIYEAKLNNVKVIKPNINTSEDKYLVHKNNIIFPLNGIKNIGENATKKIIEERKKGKFEDIFDFVKRTYGGSVNKKTILSLNDAGCFVELGIFRQTVCNNIDEIINYAELSYDLLDDYSLKPIFENNVDYDQKTILLKELEIFGFYLTNHPVTSYKEEFNSFLGIKDLNNYFDQVITIILHVDNIKVIKTKKDEDMCFLTCTDEINMIDVVMFPKIFNEYQDINNNDIVEIKARVEKRFDKLQLVVINLKNLNK